MKRRGSAALPEDRNNNSDVLFDDNRRDKIAEAASKKSFGSIRFSMAQNQPRSQTALKNFKALRR